MKILTESQFTLNQFSPINRGKWTFTSLISLHSDFLNLDEHIFRLCEGANYLFPQFVWLENQCKIQKHLKSLFRPNTYYRINICEDALWVYCKPLEEKEMFVTLALARSKKAYNCLPSFLKTPNYLLADLELDFGTDKQCDDVIFLDEKNNLAEASTSNVFIIGKSQEILTPSLSSVVLKGIMREKIIFDLMQLGQKVHEVDIAWNEGKMLEGVQEIWLTNSVSGVRFVNELEGCKFHYERSFLSTFLKKFDRYGRPLGIK